MKQTKLGNWITFMGMAAGLLAVVVFRRFLSAEFMQFNGFSIFDVPAEMPTTALGWFDLLNSNPFVGLVLMNALDQLNYFLVGLMFTAVFWFTRLFKPRWSAVGLALAWLSVLLNWFTDISFRMVWLAGQYENATQSLKSSYIYLAEGMLELNNPAAAISGPGPMLSLFLIFASGLVFSILLWQKEPFPRGTAFIGIAANCIGLSFFLTVFISADWGWIPIPLNALFRIPWYILLIIGLYRLWSVKQ